MKSSTQTILEHSAIPRHIAVIMDGNGRWAKKRFLPRVMGHKRGLDALENMVKHCAELGVRYLTVFAFSTENWRRPEEEVSFLMGLFLQALQKQVRRLHDNNMRLRVIGSRERFNAEILKGIEAAEAGFRPKLESRIAFSTFAAILLSKGFTPIVRASKSVTFATWLTGTILPQYSTSTWSSRPVCARPVRTLAKFSFNTSRERCILPSAVF